MLDALTDWCKVDDVSVSQVQGPVLIRRSKDLDEVTRLGLAVRVWVTGRHLKQKDPIRRNSGEFGMFPMSLLLCSQMVGMFSGDIFVEIIQH